MTKNRQAPAHLAVQLGLTHPDLLNDLGPRVSSISVREIALHGERHYRRNQELLDRHFTCLRLAGGLLIAQLLAAALAIGGMR